MPKVTMFIVRHSDSGAAPHFIANTVRRMLPSFNAGMGDHGSIQRKAIC